MFCPLHTAPVSPFVRFVHLMNHMVQYALMAAELYVLNREANPFCGCPANTSPKEYSPVTPLKSCLILSILPQAGGPHAQFPSQKERGRVPLRDFDTVYTPPVCVYNWFAIRILFINLLSSLQIVAVYTPILSYYCCSCPLLCRRSVYYRSC